MTVKVSKVSNDHFLQAVSLGEFNFTIQYSTKITDSNAIDISVDTERNVTAVILLHAARVSLFWVYLGRSPTVLKINYRHLLAYRHSYGSVNNLKSSRNVIGLENQWCAVRQ